MFQIHGLKKVQADPHPGNFLVSKKGSLIAIDFGCIKEIPENFYVPYFELSKKENIEDLKIFKGLLKELEILTPCDTNEERHFFYKPVSKNDAFIYTPFSE